MNFNGDMLQHNSEFIITIFCYLMVPVITMCNLIKRPLDEAKSVVSLRYEASSCAIG